MDEYKKGAFLVALSAASFAVIPIFAKFAYSAGANVVSVLTYRFLIGGFLLLFVTLFRSHKFNISAQKMFKIFLFCVLGYVLLSAFYFASFRYIPASMAVLIAYIYPALVWLIDYLTGVETFSPKKFLSLCVSFIGLVLILGFSMKGLNVKGIMFSLLAAVFFAVYIVGGNRLGKDIKPVVLSSIVTLGSGFIFFLYGIVSNTLLFKLTYTAWIHILCLAIISTVIAILSFFSGLKYVGSTNASIISILEPLVTTILSAIIFLEKMTVSQYMGGFLVLSGVASLIYFSSEKRKASKEQQKLKSNL